MKVGTSGSKKSDGRYVSVPTSFTRTDDPDHEQNRAYPLLCGKNVGPYFFCSERCQAAWAKEMREKGFAVTEEREMKQWERPYGCDYCQDTGERSSEMALRGTQAVVTAVTASKANRSEK